MSETSAGDDPLIAALIAKLPKTGSAWSLAARINWLRMFVMALNEAYGLEGAIAVSPELEARRPPLRLVPVSDAASSIDNSVAKQPPAARFVIDSEGFAMLGLKPIAPEDIPAGATLWDERRAGEQLDLSTVLWKGEGTRDPAKLPQLQVRAA